jgi:hypothetical protein
MRFEDERIFRSLDEFEREELRRLESVSASVDELIESLFGEDPGLAAALAAPSWDE